MHVCCQVSCWLRSCGVIRRDGVEYLHAFLVRPVWGKGIGRLACAEFMDRAVPLIS